MGSVGSYLDVIAIESVLKSLTFDYFILFLPDLGRIDL